MSNKVFTVLVWSIGIPVIIALIVLPPYFEMKTFNRCTGSHATYWDAVFGQLRAIECKAGTK